MKFTMITILTVISSLAFAGHENEGIGKGSAYNAEAIYTALNVKEVAVNPGFAGVSRLVKSVGGLTCEKAVVVYPNAKPSYSCTIDQSAENFKAIYLALGVKAVAVNPGIAGVGRFVKSVGGLTCQVATLIYPKAKPSYSCEMAAE